MIATLLQNNSNNIPLFMTQCDFTFILLIVLPQSHA